MLPSFFSKCPLQRVHFTFGIGSTAITAYEYASGKHGKLYIYRQEIDAKTYALACIRLFLKGISPEVLKQENVLELPFLNEEHQTIKKFDTVVMQPPFGMTWKTEEKQILKDPYARFIYGMPSMSNADWLFISTALKALNEKGKAIVITTLGTLFRAGTEERLRKRLLSFDYVETVIELTSGLLTNTGIPCALVIFNMHKAEEMKNKIQFINAASLYETVRR